MSSSFVGLFIVGYLLFTYLWSYDQALERAVELQAKEIERVVTVFDMEKKALANSVGDYAVWNDMSEFVISRDLEFIDDSLNQSAFDSHMLDGVFIFSPSSQLVWGRRYSHELEIDLSSKHLSDLFSYLLHDIQQTPTSSFSPIVTFYTLDNAPYLIATSRICNSLGQSCDNGFLLFIKQLRSSLVSQAEKSTGLNIDILMNQQELLLDRDDVSYVNLLDEHNDAAFVVRIEHDIKKPNFINRQDVSVLAIFSTFLFLFHQWMARYFIKPFKNYQNVLDDFHCNGKQVPDIKSFHSQEMQHFSRSINQLIVELEEKRAILEWQSEHDALTCVANRRKLDRVMRAKVAHPLEPYMVIFLIDIDHFKLYNDNYSHMAGDEALKSVASALDNVAFDGSKLVARFGGEEFCVILSSKSPIDATPQAEKLMNAIHELHIPHQYSPVKEFLTVSIGGVICQPTTAESYKLIFQSVDEMLYQAKLSGRDQFVIKKCHCSSYK